MKIFAKLSLAALCFTLFFNVLAIKEAKAQNVVNEILKRMTAHQNSLFSLRSKVTMVKYNSQLKEEYYILDGTTIYSQTAKNQISVRVDWRKPVVESLTLINGQYVFYRPRLKQAIMGNIRTMDDANLINAPFIQI